MSFCWSFHLALLGPSGAHWLDDLPDVTCKESTRQHAVDDALLSCEQQVGGSSPPGQLRKLSCEALTTVRRIISVLEADAPTRGS
jgi:hypothetical protein